MSTTPQDDNPYASLQSEEAAGDWSKPTRAWRDENFVVLQESGDLPSRCVLCNMARNEVIPTGMAHLDEPRKIGRWFELASILILIPSSALVGLVIWFIAKQVNPIFAGDSSNSVYPTVGALFVFGTLHEVWFKRKVAIKIAYWHCREHLYRSRTEIVRISVIFAAGVALMIWALLMLDEQSQLVTLLIFYGLIFYTLRILYPRKVKIEIARIEGGVVWLSGFGKPFVDSLPPYPHAAERSSPAID
jgi:hypothetical protein